MKRIMAIIVGLVIAGCAASIDQTAQQSGTKLDQGIALVGFGHDAAKRGDAPTAAEATGKAIPLLVEGREGVRQVVDEYGKVVKERDELKASWWSYRQRQIFWWVVTIATGVGVLLIACWFLRAIPGPVGHIAAVVSHVILAILTAGLSLLVRDGDRRWWTGEVKK